MMSGLAHQCRLSARESDLSQALVIYIFDICFEICYKIHAATLSQILTAYIRHGQ